MASRSGEAYVFPVFHTLAALGWRTGNPAYNRDHTLSGSLGVTLMRSFEFGESLRSPPPSVGVRPDPVGRCLLEVALADRRAAGGVPELRLEPDAPRHFARRRREHRQPFAVAG